MISDIIKIYDIQSTPEKAALKEPAGKANIDGDPNKAVIDRKAALERTMGDEQFLSGLLQEFTDGLPDIKEKIGNAIAYKNASALAKEANRLAGAAGNLGAVRLSDAAFDLEMASRKGFIADVHGSYRKLLQEVDSFVGYVQMAEFGNSEQLVATRA